MATAKIFYALFSLPYGTILEQVPQYKYLESWITEDGKCDYDIKTRIVFAKDAFRKHKELLKGNKLIC